MFGLVRGTVEIYDHDKTWEENATQTIDKLKAIFGSVATDIQHVGSTSIIQIKAKPIIDIAVAVNSYDDVYALVPYLKQAGFIHSPKNDIEPTELQSGQIFFICVGEKENTRTHHIHVVKTNSKEWQDYINFRNYMNAKPSVAKEYEALKLHLMTEYKNDRLAYTNGKAEFITHALRKAQVWSFLGKAVTVTIDRPIGSVHPKHDDMIYPINYGYINGVIAPDGEELDVYILGEDKPLVKFTGRIIAIVHRENDVEDKLVAIPDGIIFSADEIKSAVSFQEKIL